MRIERLSHYLTKKPAFLDFCLNNPQGARILSALAFNFAFSSSWTALCNLSNNPKAASSISYIGVAAYGWVLAQERFFTNTLPHPSTYFLNNPPPISERGRYFGIVSGVMMGIEAGVLLVP